MTPLDILYTPLDVPDPPVVDPNLFARWASLAQPMLATTPSSQRAMEVTGYRYPWTRALGRYRDQGWINGFDELFPELARYTYEAFGIDAADADNVLFLQTKTAFVGQGVWHSDIDETGLRFYLTNSGGSRNWLSMVPTVVPHERRPSFGYEEDPADARYQPVVLTTRYLRARHAFYLNNVRAIHSPWVTEPTQKIAVLVSGSTEAKAQRIKDATRDLVVDSALKFANHALLWPTASAP